MNATLHPVSPISIAPACPRCGALLPLPRPVRAANLRCPSDRCAAPVRIRGGSVRLY